MGRNKALCADRENTPLGALRFSGNGFHYRHSVPILPQVWCLESAWEVCNSAAALEKLLGRRVYRV